MSNLNTELMTALLKNESIDEVFRSHLEAAMNDLPKIELPQFLGYEKSNKGLPRSKSSFLMKMHLSASYAAIIVI